VVLVGDTNLNTLYHLRFRTMHEAERGRHGEGSNRTGASGDDREIRVPLGTLVYDEDKGSLLGELLEHEQTLVVAAGGRGGRGNARFASATRQAPRHAQPGEAGVELFLRLELRLLADVGIVGLPNAGKSTFISAVSAARPKIADYPFTTLAPQLGVVAEGPLADPFVIADLPGLIEGAAQGAGLGHQFLRHVERCRVLLHFVDLSGDQATGGTAVADLATIEQELESFNPDLLQRPRLIVGTKLDAVQAERSEELRLAAEERDLPYFELSAVSGEGVKELSATIRATLSRGDLV
jgi:GTP-binding protein